MKLYLITEKSDSSSDIRTRLILMILTVFHTGMLEAFLLSSAGDVMISTDATSLLGPALISQSRGRLSTSVRCCGFSRSLKADGGITCNNWRQDHFLPNPSGFIVHYHPLIRPIAYVVEKDS
jgi:hypothetical protein